MSKRLELVNSDLWIGLSKTNLPLTDDINLEEDKDYMLRLCVSVEGVLVKGEKKTILLKYNGGPWDIIEE